MSGYWSATSGTVLVFPKEEVRDFFTRYLLETYRKDGATDRDVDFIDCTISEYGSDSFYFLRSAYRQSLLEDFHSLESCVNERTAAEHKKERVIQLRRILRRRILWRSALSVQRTSLW